MYECEIEKQKGQKSQRLFWRLCNSSKDKSRFDSLEFFWDSSSGSMLNLQFHVVRIWYVSFTQWSKGND